MIVSPSMGLKRWDQPNDIFSYTELSDNFATIDSHDHTTGKGVQIPTAGLANLAVDSTKLADNSVTTNKIVASSVDSTRLANLAATDAKLASPNNGVYRTLFSTHMYVNISLNGSVVYGITQGGGFVQSGGTSPGPLVSWPFPSAAHYAVAGKTTKLRVLGSLLVNASAPAANFTLGLSPLTAVSGSPGNILPTYGAMVAGSSVSITAPGASSVNTLTGSDFDIPATGVYAPALSVNVSNSVNSLINISFFLQIRHV